LLTFQPAIGVADYNALQKVVDAAPVEGRKLKIKTGKVIILLRMIPISTISRP
jgi:hypothetical protein